MHIKETFGLRIILNMLFGKAHEDFGLIPIVLIQANIVSSIDVPLYYYIRRTGSATKNYTSESLKKSSYDTLYHFDKIAQYIKNSNIKDHNKKIILSHMANNVINKASSLDGKNRKDYKKELKKRDVISLLATDTLKRKIKKFVLMVKAY